MKPLPRYTYLGILAIVIIAASAVGYLYAVPALFPAKTIPPTIIHILPGSSHEPPGWQSYLNLSSSTFRFPVNITVTIGVNNTIQWINDDNVAHTVTAFVVPQGTTYFNSGLINQGKTFTLTLTTPGVYKYFCAWHNWLAGVITVKPA